MEETKTLLLEDNEVDEYYRLQEKFDEVVEEEVQRKYDLKTHWRFMRHAALAWWAFALTLWIFGIKVIT